MATDGGHAANQVRVDSSKHMGHIGRGTKCVSVCVCVRACVYVSLDCTESGEYNYKK